MTTPGNGTTRRIIAGLTVASILFLGSMVISNTTRIAAIEVKIEAVGETIETCAEQIKDNRAETRIDMKEISSKLDELMREVSNIK